MQLAPYENDQVAGIRRPIDSPVFGNSQVDSACRAFWLALLLTQSTTVAESVVIAAIESSLCNELPEVALMIEVARTSWRKYQDLASSALDVLNARLLIPPELRKVLGLPRTTRYCFCLRVLVGISAAASGELMSLQPEEIDHVLEMSIDSLADSSLLFSNGRRTH